MRRIVDDLDGRRRALAEAAKTKIEAFARVEAPLSGEQRRELARWRRLARFQPPVVDFLKAQVLIAEKRYGEALAALERVTEGHRVRPGLFLQTADLYLQLGRAREAQQVYEKALAIDPDDRQAHLGMCRLALRRRKFGIAANSALEALQRSHHDPLAHFLLGRALVGMKEYERAGEAFRAAISLNPNFPEAHTRLAALLDKHLEDSECARQHRRLARRMRGRTALRPPRLATAGVPASPDTPATDVSAEMPPLSDSLIVVTGLPRSGTSLVMQMLAAGGLSVLSDGLRVADEDNPRGYLEFEPVKRLLKDSKWLSEARGKAIKIIAPLLIALPPRLACRVILCKRDLDEVLDSQDRMLLRRNQPLAATPERRRLLKDEYERILERVYEMLTQRPDSQLLVVEYGTAVSDALVTAERMSKFLGGGLDVARMAAAVEPALHRNRSGLLN